MTVLVLAEHDHAAIRPATHGTVAAAAALGGEIVVLVAGYGCAPAAAAAARISGVARVLRADDAAYEHHLAENLALLVKSLADGYSHVLAPATTFGKNVLPRVAAMLDVAQISDVIAIEAPDTFRRPIYAGNAIATVRSADAVKVITVRGTAFPPAAAEGGDASVEDVASMGDTGLSAFVGRESSGSGRPELTAAKVVVSGGRGMRDREGFRLLEAVADKLGGAVGASRAAVDAGFAPNDFQVGQTGKIVAPDLYIAAGISGAIQHLAGIKDSKVIVAINKDEEAPIFEVADYGLVADLFDVLPELAEKL